MPPGARSTPPTAPPEATAPTGASPTSCFRSGARCPLASSRVHVHARAWVPLDDGHTMFCFLRWKRGVSSQTQPQPAFKDGRPIGGTGRGNKLLPNTTEWLGRFRLAANESNDWGMDRKAQSSNAIYSGIDGVHLQDQAITESMGPVTDHAFEHLAPSDQMITRTRRRLLMAARRCATTTCCRPVSKTRKCFAGDAAATSSATTRARGRSSMRGNCPRRCILRPSRCGRLSKAAVSPPDIRT